MVQNFDIFNQPEKPSLVLCKPNKSELTELRDAFDVRLKLQFNAVSELEFKIHKLPITESKNLFDEFPMTAGDCKIWKTGEYWAMSMSGTTGQATDNLNLNWFKYKTRYTFSGLIYETNESSNLALYAKYKDGTSEVIKLPLVAETSFSYTSIADKTIDYIYWNNGISGETTYIKHFQIEEGTSATSYEVFNHNYYEEIVNEKWVHMIGVGYFVIKHIEIVNDGLNEYKDVQCKSIDIKIGDKHLVRFSGTYEFYDPVTPEGTLMATIIDLIPSWDLGTIDSGLWTKYRTFDISDQSILNFLLNDVSQAYECVFEFDFEDQDINIKELANVGTDTNIFIGYNNLIKTLKVEEDASELVTCLRVWGSNDLTIRHVNPSGTDKMYDLSYVKNPDFMSQDLIDAIDAYEAIFAANQSTYASELTSWRTKNNELVVLQADLVTLEGDLTALNTVKVTQIQGSQDLTTINGQIAAKVAEIVAQQALITSKIAEITVVDGNLDAINTTVSLANNFTVGELAELDNFLIEQTYQDEAFLITDIMTEAEKQDMAQALYDQAETVLARMAQPRITFDVDVIDFIKLVDFESFTDELSIGNNITVELREGLFYEVRLMGIEHDWENDKLKLTFSNKYRMDDPSFTLQELLDNSFTQSSTVSFGKYIYGDYRDSGDKDAISTYMSNALNAAVQLIKSNDDSDITINENGILLRQNDGIGGYDDEQMWIVNNMIAFSDDGFDTANLAIGKINDGDYGEVFGVVADVIVGTILAGNNLRITNTAGQFQVDEDGCVLTDMTLTMEKSDLTSKIFLDPTTGIKIQGKIGGTYQDVFKVDTAGRIQANYLDISGDSTFGGTLSGADGTFSGTLSACTITGSTITSGTGLPTITMGNDGKIIFKYNGVQTGFIWGSTGGVMVAQADNWLVLGAGLAVTIDITGKTISMDSSDIEISSDTAINISSGSYTLLTGTTYYGAISGNNIVATLGSLPDTSDFRTETQILTLISNNSFNSGNTHSHTGSTSGGQITWASISNPPSLPTGTIVGTTDSQSLSNKTLTQPIISDFTYATHSHSTNFYGGKLGTSAMSTGLYSGNFITKDDEQVNVTNGLITSVV